MDVEAPGRRLFRYATLLVSLASPGGLRGEAKPRMQPPSTCQSCRRSATGSLLSYRKGPADVVRNEALLQCDVCERFACAECLQVYDIFSGYDFLCHECARQFDLAAAAPLRGH